MQGHETYKSTTLQIDAPNDNLLANHYLSKPYLPNEPH